MLNSVTQISSFMIFIINCLYSCYNDFALHLESLWTFQIFLTSSSISKYTHIFTQIPRESVWSWKIHHTWLHIMDLCTSACTISNKLVIRSSLAYGRSFNYLEESLTCVNWSKSKAPKIHQHGVSSCFLSNIIQTAMSLHKWSFNHLSCDILALVLWSLFLQPDL